MPVSLIQGKLGTGKGKLVMLKIRQALRDGKRVATNCDLFLEHMMPSQSKMTALRLPDKPTPADLMLMGKGYEGKINPKKEGVLALDELGSWLNARSYQDKNRAGFLDWLIHARKFRWTTYLLAQDVEMIDKQVRTAVVEYLVKCINLENVKIPIIGHLLGEKGKLPRMHVAVTTLTDVPGVQIDREMYRADDLHQAYDTEQAFREWAREPNDRGFRDEIYGGPFSYLSAWHLKGRFETAPAPRKTFLQALFSAPEKPALKPKLALVQKLAKLPRDKAWFYARRLNMQGVI